MTKLKNIRIVGTTYHNGRRCSGFAHAFIEGKQYPRFYGEGSTFDLIIKDLTSKGIDCLDLTARLDRWVKTGK